MSNRKLQCPICNQEFPAYDQRGFRNAGFTSHHNRCLERQQQRQNEPQQDKQSSRASRFALAIRRRLLPAQPVSPPPTSTTIEVHKRNSILSVLPRRGPGPGTGSGSTSSPLLPSYGTHSHHTNPTPLITPIVPSQAPLQHQPIPRQRHTWNHGNRGMEDRRSTSVSTQDKARSPVISPSRPRSRTITPPSILPSDLSSSLAVSTCRVVHVTNNTTKDSNFPLLTTVIAMNSTAALIIPQTTPTDKSTTPMNSPTLPGSSPFSFISMLTTLPLESTPLDPCSTVSLFSSSSNSNFNNLEDTTRDYRHHPSVYSSVDMHQRDPMTSDWMLNDHSLHPSSLQQHHQEQQEQQQQQQQQHGNQHLDPHLREQHHNPQHNLTQQPHFYDQHQYSYLTQITENDIYGLQNINMPSTSSPTITTCASVTNPIHPSIHMDQLQTVTFCEYCQPQHGLHHPSCCLLESIMADIMRGDGSDDYHP